MPWWASPATVVNSPPKATRELVMAAPKAPKTPLAVGAQLWRLPPEVLRAARWPRPVPPTVVKWPPTYRIEEDTARASTSPLVWTFQMGAPPVVGP